MNNRCQRVAHAGDLLVVQACKVQPTVGADVEDGKGAVQHAQRHAIHQFDDKAGLADTLIGEVRYSCHVFLPEHAHERRTGQLVQGVVPGEEK